MNGRNRRIPSSRFAPSVLYISRVAARYTQMRGLAVGAVDYPRAAPAVAVHGVRVLAEQAQQAQCRLLAHDGPHGGGHLQTRQTRQNKRTQPRKTSTRMQSFWDMTPTKRAVSSELRA